MKIQTWQNKRSVNGTELCSRCLNVIGQLVVVSRLGPEARIGHNLGRHVHLPLLGLGLEPDLVTHALGLGQQHTVLAHLIRVVNRDRIIVLGDSLQLTPIPPLMLLIVGGHVGIEEIEYAGLRGVDGPRGRHVALYLAVEALLG